MAPINHVILNENGQFYKKEANDFLSNNRLESIFRIASSERKGNYLLNLKSQPSQNYPNEAKYSICVFKFIAIPSFIDTELKNWVEEKLAYLLIVDFKDYLFIAKKNITGLQDELYEGLSEIDYKVLTTLLVDDETTVERVSLNSTSIVSDALKHKTVEANNLVASFPTYGAGRYIPGSTRLNNKDEKTSIVFNTSRISKLGEKRYINELIDWAYSIVDKIKNHVDKSSFFSVFAEPIDYANHWETIQPISILIHTVKIFEDIENEKITGFKIQLGDGRQKEIQKKYIFKLLNPVYSIERIDNEEGFCHIISSFPVKDVEIKLNKKSITIKSTKLSKIHVVYGDGSTDTIVKYLNMHNDYVINFEEFDLVYYNRKLFKDSNLINNVSQFLSVFLPDPALENVISEKGDFVTGSTNFSDDSIFRFIKDNILNDSTYAFLDDLGDEWADFIKVKDYTLTFIHAKHDTSILSASSFHDVVGQALKNIGNFSPSIDRLRGHKKNGWSENYNIDGVETEINRLLHGDNIDNAITAYEKLLLNPNLLREVSLVINFISKSTLEDRITKLRHGTSFRERNQVIQILWVISSLVNSCMENGISIHICCKP